jgi:transposase
MKKGAPWLKTTLVQCAWAATRTNGSHLQAQFLRIRSRRGAKKAIDAVAASILTAAYHMLCQSRSSVSSTVSKTSDSTFELAP